MVTPSADDEAAVRRAARDAMRLGIEDDAGSACDATTLRELVTDRESAANRFYGGE